MIAPLWADFDFREHGTIYHRVENDTIIMDEISQRIAVANELHEDYMPKEAVIVTWFQSRLFEDPTTVGRVKLVS